MDAFGDLLGFSPAKPAPTPVALPDDLFTPGSSPAPSNSAAGFAFLSEPGTAAPASSGFAFLGQGSGVAAPASPPSSSFSFIQPGSGAASVAAGPSVLEDAFAAVGLSASANKVGAASGGLGGSGGASGFGAASPQRGAASTYHPSSGASGPAVPSDAELDAMGAGALKRFLEQRLVDHRRCVEKSELLALAKATAQVARSAAQTPGQGSGGGGGGAFGGAGGFASPSSASGGGARPAAFAGAPPAGGGGVSRPTEWRPEAAPASALLVGLPNAFELHGLTEAGGAAAASIAQQKQYEASQYAAAVMAGGASGFSGFGAASSSAVPSSAASGGGAFAFLGGAASPGGAPGQHRALPLEAVVAHMPVAPAAKLRVRAPCAVVDPVIREVTGAFFRACTTELSASSAELAAAAVGLPAPGAGGGGGAAAAPSAGASTAASAATSGAAASAATSAPSAALQALSAPQRALLPFLGRHFVGPRRYFELPLRADASNAAVLAAMQRVGADVGLSATHATPRSLVLQQRVSVPAHAFAAFAASPTVLGAPGSGRFPTYIAAAAAAAGDSGATAAGAGTDASAGGASWLSSATSAVAGALGLGGRREVYANAVVALIGVNASLERVLLLVASRFMPAPGDAAPAPAAAAGTAGTGHVPTGAAGAATSSAASAAAGSSASHPHGPLRYKDRVGGTVLSASGAAAAAAGSGGRSRGASAALPASSSASASSLFADLGATGGGIACVLTPKQRAPAPVNYRAGASVAGKGSARRARGRGHGRSGNAAAASDVFGEGLASPAAVSGEGSAALDDVFGLPAAQGARSTPSAPAGAGGAGGTVTGGGANAVTTAEDAVLDVPSLPATVAAVLAGLPSAAWSTSSANTGAAADGSALRVCGLDWTAASARDWEAGFGTSASSSSSSTAGATDGASHTARPAGRFDDGSVIVGPAAGGDASAVRSGVEDVEGVVAGAAEWSHLRVSFLDPEAAPATVLHAASANVAASGHARSAAHATPSLAATGGTFDLSALADELTAVACELAAGLRGQRVLAEALWADAVAAAKGALATSRGEDAAARSFPRPQPLAATLPASGPSAPGTQPAGLPVPSAQPVPATAAAPASVNLDDVFAAASAAASAAAKPVRVEDIFSALGEAASPTQAAAAAGGASAGAKQPAESGVSPAPLASPHQSLPAGDATHDAPAAFAAAAAGDAGAAPLFHVHPDTLAALAAHLAAGGESALFKAAALYEARARRDEWLASQVLKAVAPTYSQHGLTPPRAPALPRLDELPLRRAHQRGRAGNQGLGAAGRGTDDATGVEGNSGDDSEEEEEEEEQGSGAPAGSSAGSAYSFIGGGAAEPSSAGDAAVADDAEAAAAAVQAATGSGVNVPRSSPLLPLTPAGLTAAEETVREVYLRAYLTCRAAARAGALAAALQQRATDLSMRARLRRKARHVALRCAAAFTHAVAALSALQESCHASAPSADPGRALVAGIFGVHGEASLLHAAASALKLLGDVTLTPRRLLFHANVLGFRTKRAVPLDAIVAVTAASTMVGVDATLTVTYVDDEKRAALAAAQAGDGSAASAAGGAAAGGVASRKRASTVGGALLDMFGLGPGSSKHSAAANSASTAAGAEPAAGGAAAPGADLFGGLAVAGNVAPAAAPAAASVSVKDAFDALCEIDASGGNDGGRASAGGSSGGTAVGSVPPAARRSEAASSTVLPALSPTSEAAAALPPLLQPLAGVLTPDDLLVYIGTGGSAECLSQLHITPLGAPREALYVALQTLRQLEARPHVREFSFPLLAEADPAAIAAAHAAAVQAAGKLGGAAAGAGAGTIGVGAAGASGAGAAAAAAATWLASSAPGPAAGASTQAGQASWRVLQHLRLLHVPADLGAALARTEADVDAAAAAAAAGVDTGSAGSSSGGGGRGGPAAWRGQSLSTPLLLREDKHSVLSTTRARAASNYHTTGDAARAGGASAGASAAAGSSTGAAAGQPAAGGFAGFWGSKAAAAPAAGGRLAAQEDLLSGVADLFAPAPAQPVAQTAAAGGVTSGGGTSSAMFLGSPGLEGYADLAASGMYEDI